MQDLDLTQINNIHFIGIGGIGISAIARMMLSEGKNVSGQDMQDSEILKELKKAGAKVSVGQDFAKIPKKTDLIVYTIAIENYDTELFQNLKNHEIPIRSYPEMLNIVTRGKYTIAVSGTHGKTTTTGMIAQVLKDSGNDPTVVVGSLLVGENTNFISGNSQYFVVEACEYRRSFLNINPNILVITNIDADHLDYYKDMDDIKSAFRELALKVPKDGFVICNPIDQFMIDVVAGIEAQVVDYERFFDENMELNLPGIHNKKNAACALAVANCLNIDESNSIGALKDFVGVTRRFELKGDLSCGAKIYDDYAHHPTEIRASLQGFRELYRREDGYRVIVVFQPHLFSRTKSLLEYFSSSFEQADLVLLLPIYYAREEDDGSISSKILSEKIIENNTQALSLESFESVKDYINNLELSEKDIIITMGAGEAFTVGDMLLGK